MHRHFFVLISILFLSVSMFADNDLPIFLMHRNLGVDWHDMFDALNCRKVEENRHAVNIRVQYAINIAMQSSLSSSSQS